MADRVNFKNKTVGIRNLCCLLAVIILVIAGCSGKYPEPDSLVVTIDNSKISMNEMMYHIMLEKLQGELYASFLDKGIKDYWGMKGDNGKTMWEEAKAQAMENAVKYEIFYQKAKQKGYTLTEAEKKASLEKAENILKNIPADQLDTYGLSKEKLIGIQEKITVATDCYNNYIDSFLDKEAIKKSIDVKKYEQYDIEYIYGNRNQKDKVGELTGKADAEADYSALAEKAGLKSGKLTFLKGAGTFGEEDNLEEIITSMKAGQVSGLVETTKGYYIIKLKDNTSRSEYEKAVEKAVKEAETANFDKKYKALKAEHNITVNTKVWEKVVIGK